MLNFLRGFGQPMPKPEPITSNTLKTCVSIARKINLGNYESAEVMMTISNIDVNTTPDQIQAALAAGALGYDALKVALTEKIKDQRHACDSQPKTKPTENQNAIPKNGRHEISPAPVGA